MAKFVTSIAGNIGAGKSCFLKYLEENKQEFNRFLKAEEKVLTVQESIDPIALKLFYRNREAYTSIFEESCLVDRKVRHMEAKEEPHIYFFDRGVI